MKSMTGYGEAQAQGKVAKVAVQVRTVNHRHLDIQLRVPRSYLSVEEAIRQKIRQRLNRGRVELLITRSLVKGKGRRLEFDDALLDQYLAALKQAKKKFGLRGETDLLLLTRIPELFEYKEDDSQWQNERGIVLKTVEAALANLDRSRTREGDHLKRDMQNQVQQLRKLSGALEREARSIYKSLLESLAPREAGRSHEGQRPGKEHENSLPKGDIHEEVVRLKSHVEGLSKLMRERGAVGKKLDFLLQETQRELSTIGAKAIQLSTVGLVLSGKEKVEKIREQVQNVE
ncbi:MAG TPA: YicC/YloC family endoribonuclease [Candidatus Binatia bacterium]